MDDFEHLLAESEPVEARVVNSRGSIDSRGRHNASESGIGLMAFGSRPRRRTSGARPVRNRRHAARGPYMTSAREHVVLAER